MPKLTPEQLDEICGSWITTPEAERGREMMERLRVAEAGEKVWKDAVHKLGVQICELAELPTDPWPGTDHAIAKIKAERDALRRKLDGVEDTPLLLDTDYVARMSPHKFTVGLKVSDVRKGEPRPVPDTPGPTRTDTERLVAEFLAFQAGFTDSQRVDFWAELAQGYCRNCGRKEKYAEICQCENDE